MRFSGIHLKANSPGEPKILLCIMSSKIIPVSLLPHFPGANELKHRNTQFVLATLLAMSERIPNHDDVIKRKHFPRHWSLVWGIPRSPVNSPHKGQWRGALIFSLICAWIYGWVNNRETGDLRRYRTHYDVNVMIAALSKSVLNICDINILKSNPCINRCANTLYCIFFIRRSIDNVNNVTKEFNIAS